MINIKFPNFLNIKCFIYYYIVIQIKYKISIDILYFDKYSISVKIYNQKKKNYT